MADVQSLFLRGKEAADRGNYEYAIALFLDILRARPDERNTRIALRGCEMEMFRSHGGGAKAKFMGFLKGLGPLLLMHLQASKPEKVMVACERYLVNDPTSVYVLRKLAAAFVKNGFLDAAADTLEFARQRASKNLAVLRALGDVCHAQGNYDKAVKCYQEVIAIKPEDRTAAQRVKDISAESHLKRSHLEESESYRDGLRDEEKADELERGAQIVQSSDNKDSRVAQLAKQADENPEDAKAQADLGDALVNAGRFEDAEAAYAKAFKISKRYSMREKLGDTRIRRLEHAEEEAKAKAEDGHMPADFHRASEATKARIEFCIKEFKFRREQHPTDMKLAYQLGLYLFESEEEANLQQAIQQFQQTMSNSSLKLRAQFMLGRCFARNPKTLDMAKEQFQSAYDGLETQTTEMGKQLLYAIAQIDEKLNNAEEALAKYKKIFSVDAGFKDVAQKIQTLG